LDANSHQSGSVFKANQQLAYSTWDVDLVIERQGDELRIRPAQRRMGDVLGKLAKFSPDFMAQGRGENVEGEREAL
jgi:antitoxin VapB